MDFNKAWVVELHYVRTLNAPTALPMPVGAASRWPGYCSSFGGSDPDPEIPESRKTDKPSGVIPMVAPARRGPTAAPPTVSTRQPVIHGSGEWMQGKSPKDMVKCGLAARTPPAGAPQAPSQKRVQVANCGISIRPFQVADNEPEEHEDRDVRHDHRCYHDGASLPGQGRCY